MNPVGMHDKRRLLLILVIFFLTRLIFAFLIDGSPLPKTDAYEYDNYANVILKDSGWLSSSDFEGSKREPLYPAFLALVYLLFGKNNFLAVAILQAFINTLTVFLIYKLALAVFGKKAAFVAFLWSGLYIFYLWFIAHLMRETLVCFFLSSFLYFLYVWLTSPSFGKARIFITSLLFFLLIHTDSRYLYLLPCILILFFIYQRYFNAIKHFFIFSLIVIILSVPWGIRNYIVYDNFVMISVSHFHPGWNLIKGYRHMLNITLTEALNVAHNPDYPTEEERKLVKKGFNPNNRSAEEINAIRNDIYPASTYLDRKWDNLKELWRSFMTHGIYRRFPGCRFESWSLRHNLVSIIFYGLLLPFVVIGVIAMAINKNKAIWFFILPVFLHALIHTFVWGEYRYRVPIDSFLIILGGYGIVLAHHFIVTTLKGKVS